MAIRRGAGSFRRGPAPLFKKRIVRFSVTVSNSTPSPLFDLIIRETSTIYAASIDIYQQSISPAEGDLQMGSYTISCNPAVEEPGSEPDWSTITDIETINGFVVGSMMSGIMDGTAVSETAVMGHIREKFRFRRRCVENTHVRMLVDTLVTDGAARSVIVSGTVSLILRVR